MGRCAGGPDCRRRCLEKVPMSAGGKTSSNGRCGGRVFTQPMGSVRSNPDQRTPVSEMAKASAFVLHLQGCGRQRVGGASFPQCLVGGTATRGGDGKESPCRPRHHNPAQQGRKPPSASAPTVPLFWYSICPEMLEILFQFQVIL